MYTVFLLFIKTVLYQNSTKTPYRKCSTLSIHHIAYFYESEDVNVYTKKERYINSYQSYHY